MNFEVIIAYIQSNPIPVAIAAAALVLIIVVILTIRNIRAKPVREKTLAEISSFHDKWAGMQEQYIALSQLKDLQNSYNDTFQTARRFHGKAFSDFRKEYSALEDSRKKHNSAFVQHEVQNCAKIFDNVEGNKLDQQQREAIVTDEDHNLVIAGAGAGKTLTIAGKVKYLCDRKRVNPNDILLIAFSNKAAAEMNKRISKNMGYPVKAITFHKFGMDTITAANQKKPVVFEENDFKLFMNEFFKKRVINQPKVMESLITYFAFFLNIPPDFEQFSTFGEAIEYERNSDLETIRSKYEYVKAQMAAGKAVKLTLQGEYVRSIEELTIANFLFLHGVNYEYEHEFPFAVGPNHSYRPDFYLTDYNIYYEHFGITKDNRVPWLNEIEEKKYLDTMQWKRNIHKKYKTRLIETYSWYQREGILLEKLKEILKQNGVQLYEPNYTEIYQKLYQNIGDRYFREFIKLCSSFINLFKSNGYSTEDILHLTYKNKEYDTKFHKERLQLFKSIISPIMTEYSAKLRETGKIDFSDMINQAANLIRNGNMIHPYKFVIVDEYQDIAISRGNLLDAIIEQTGAHLLCVGDDWQSIYRFTGSDIGLFTGFEQHYEGTEIMRIEQTYRNSQQLINAASRFITKNPAQFKKSLRSEKSRIHPVHFYIYQKEKDAAIKKAVDDIIQRFGKNKTILFLGRVNAELDRLLETNLFSLKGEKENGELVYHDAPSVPIQFMTIHGSKGQESDNVIILNFNNALLGIPNKISDDPILELVLSTADTYRYAEERRLLYVAITRTRNEVFLITSRSRPSEFFKDFIDDPDVDRKSIDFSESKSISCPRCQTGKLIERSGPFSKFVGCTNYPACLFKVKDTTVLTAPVFCKQCHGLMVHKPDGALVCSNAPLCNNTVSLAGKKKPIHKTFH